MSPKNDRSGRRGFLMTLAGLVPVAKLVAASDKESSPKMVRIVEFDAAGNRTEVELVEKIVKSDDEWRKQLSPQQFEVTRKKGTEIAGTGKYAETHADGLYHCICCDTVLFDSKTKFESGTGWPSFYQPIAKENVKTNNDFSF
jgi:peptide-methionine (R)-S-oxide reductase